jgi:hypothetical protein
MASTSQRPIAGSAVRIGIHSIPALHRQQPVERIAVVIGQRMNRQRMAELDGERQKPCCARRDAT